jgi:hypothetical protein
VVEEDEEVEEVEEVEDVEEVEEVEDVEEVEEVEEDEEVEEVEEDLSESEVNKGTNGVLTNVVRTFLICLLNDQPNDHHIKAKPFPSARSRKRVSGLETEAPDVNVFNTLVAGLPDKYVSPISLQLNFNERTE